MPKSRIGLGTAAIGRPLYINLRQGPSKANESLAVLKAQGFGLLDTAFSLGIRHFDTAPNYGFAEELLIQWLASQKDPSLTVSSKWGYEYLANFDPDAKEHERKEHSLKMLGKQWPITQKLLPRLKLYQIHSAQFESGLFEDFNLLRKLDELKQEHNLILGFTSTGNNQIETLKRGLEVQIGGERLFESVQFTFNILDQSVLELKSDLETLDGPILIKEVLANGRLIPNSTYKNHQDLYESLNKVAANHQVGVDAIALRFAMQKFSNAVILSGADNQEHLISNLKAEKIEMSSSELKLLSSFAMSTKDYWLERKRLQWY